MGIPVRFDSFCNADSDAASSFQAEGGEGLNPQDPAVAEYTRKQ